MFFFNNISKNFSATCFTIRILCWFYVPEFTFHRTTFSIKLEMGSASSTPKSVSSIKAFWHEARRESEFMDTRLNEHVLNIQSSEINGIYVVRSATPTPNSSQTARPPTQCFHQKGVRTCVFASVMAVASDLLKSIAAGNFSVSALRAK